MSDSLQPHEMQHTRLFCPLLSPGVCSHSCPLSRWCHPTISSSVACFSSWPQSFPASRCFPMSWLFILGGQSIGASALASVRPMNIQGWFLLELWLLVDLGNQWLFSPSHVLGIYILLTISTVGTIFKVTAWRLYYIHWLVLVIFWWSL